MCGGGRRSAVNRIVMWWDGKREGHAGRGNGGEREFVESAFLCAVCCVLCVVDIGYWITLSVALSLGCAANMSVCASTCMEEVEAYFASLHFTFLGVTSYSSHTHAPVPSTHTLSVPIPELTKGKKDHVLFGVGQGASRSLCMTKCTPTRSKAVGSRSFFAI